MPVYDEEKGQRLLRWPILWLVLKARVKKNEKEKV